MTTTAPRSRNRTSSQRCLGGKRMTLPVSGRSLRSGVRSSVLGLLASMAAYGLIGTKSARAQSTWDGGANNTNLSSAANWTGDVAPANNTAWVFGSTNGSQGLTLNNDFAANWTNTGITFNAGSLAYIINGNTLTLGGNIVNNSSALQTFGTGFVLSAARTITTTSGGGNLLFNGAISGAQNLIFNGTGTSTLAVSNSYTGTTTVNGGATLNINASGAIGTNVFTVTSGTVNFGTSGTNNTTPVLSAASGQTAIVYITNGAMVYNTNGSPGRMQLGVANANSTNMLVLQSGGVFSNTTANGQIILGSYGAAGALNVISNNGGSLIGFMQMTRNGGSGATNLYIQGSGTTIFTSALNMMTGNPNQTNNDITEQFVIAGGLFSNSGNITIGNSSSNYFTTNSYHLISNGAAQFTASGFINFGWGLSNVVGMTNVLIMGDGTLGNGTMTINGIQNGFNTNSGYTNRIIWNGGVLQAGAATGATFWTNAPNTLVTISNAGGIFDIKGFANTIGANISGNGGLTVKNSSTTTNALTLTGSNSYTGPTVVQGGTLVLTNGGSLANSALTITNTGYSSLTYTNAAGTTLNIISGSTNGLAVGQNIVGNGIPANATIVSFTANTITISASATANTTAFNAGIYNSTGIVQAYGATLTNVSVWGNSTSYYTGASTNGGTAGSANLVLSNTTVNGTLTINGPTVSSNSLVALTANYAAGSSGANYGYATANTGTIATNITLNGRLDVLGSGSMNLSGITGASNNNYLYGGGSGGLMLSSTYNATNSAGGYGNVLGFASNGNIGQILNVSTGSGGGGFTFTNGGGTVTIGMYQFAGYNGAAAGSYNYINTFSGGNWNIGQSGQGNSGQQAGGTNVLLNGANITFTTNTGLQMSGIWVIGSAANGAGTLTFLTNAAVSGSQIAASPETWGTLVNSNGALNLNGSLTLNNKSTNQTAYLTNNGGTVNIGGAVVLSANTAGVNNTNAISQNAGSMTLGTNLTIGQNTTNATITNQYNIFTLGGGSLTVKGTIGAGTNPNNEFNSFLWTGGTLAAGTITATNTTWNGVGSSISSSTLNNTNGNLFVGNNTNGYAGKTTITGNYTQSGSATSTFNIFGNTAATTWAGATNQYSQLAATGTANVGGNIVLNITGGFFTTGGTNTFNIVTSTGLSGAATLAGPNLINGYALAGDGYSLMRLATNGTTLVVTNSGLVNQWQGGAGTWGATTNNWSQGVNPTNNSLGAYFGSTGSGGTVSVSGNKTISSLVFSNATTGYTLANSGSPTITLGNSYGATIMNYAGTHTVAPSISLVTNLTVGNSGTLTLSGNISGPASLTTTNAGLTILSGSNSYTGNTTVGGGTLSLGNSNAIGSGTLTLIAGTALDETLPADLTLTNALNLNNFTYVGSGNLIQTNGAIALQSGTTITVNSNNLTLGGGISGAYALTKAGNGTLTLANSNSYSGGSTMSAGTMIVGNNNAFGTGGLTLTTGTLQASTDVSITNTVSLGNNTITFAGANNITFTASTAGGFIGGGDKTLTNNMTSGKTLTFSGNLGMNGNGTGRSLTVNGTGNTVFSGVLSDGSGGGVGNFTFNSTGNTLLSGNNVFHGKVTVNSGATLQLGNSNALGFGGNFNSQNITTVNGTTISSGGVLDLNGNAGINEQIVLNGTGISGNGALINNSTSAAGISSGIATIALPATGSGSGLSSLPTITISGTGSGASATASSLGLTLASVTSISGGTGWKVGDKVNLTGGGGSGAIGVVGSVDVNGGITSLSSLTACGSGYTTAPTGFTSNTATQAVTVGTLTGNASNFTVAAITLDAAGSGYTGTPTMTWAGGGSATVALSSVTLATNSSIGGSGNTTIDAVVGESGGSRALTKVGTGTLIFTGNNTYTGGTIISSGALQVGNGGTTGALGAGDVTNNSSLVFNRSDDITVTNAISGTGTLTKSGSGSATLTASNAYAGGTVINGGTLAFTNSSALGTGSISNAATLAYNGSGSTTLANGVSGNGSLRVNSGILTLTGTDVSSGLHVVNGTLKYGGSGNSTPGLLAGSGTINQTAGTVTLASGNHTFNGAANLSGGTLVVSSGANLSSSTLTASGGTITGTGTLGTTVLNSGSTVNVSRGVSAGTLTVGNLTINGGTFAWNLFGSTADIINAGAVTFANSSYVINVNNAVDTNWNSAVSTNYTILTGTSYSGFNVANFTVNGGNAGLGGKWALSNDVSAGLVLTYTVSDQVILVSSDVGVTTLQTVATNTVFADNNGNAIPVVMSGAGEYVLDMTNTYSGSTTIGSGTLTAQNNSSFGSSSDIYVGTKTNAASNAAVNINTAGVTVGSIITVQGSGTNMIVNSSGGGVTYSGGVNLNSNATVLNTAGGNLNVSGAISGAGQLNVSPGSGTVTLAAANSYNGGTTLNGGTLALGNSAALGSGTLAVSSNATEQALASINVTNASTVASSSTLTLDANGNSFTNSGNIAGQGSLRVSDSTGAGTLTLSGSNSYAGTSTVNRGTLALGSTNALPSANSLTVSGTGVLNANGYNATVSVLADGGVSTGIITNTTGASTLTVNGSSSSSFLGTIAGALGLTKSGSGTLTLGGNDTYTGATLVNGGAMTLNGSLSNTAITVTNSTLTEGSSGSIAGTTGLTVQSNGVVSLSGNNTFSGNTTVNAGGALSLLTGSTFGSATLSNAGNLVVNRNDYFLFTNALAVTGSGSITYSGTGTTVVNNTNNSFVSTANVYLTGGTLVNGSSTYNSIIRSGTFTMTGGVLDLAGNNFGNQSGIVITDGGSAGGIVTNSGSTTNNFQSTQNTNTTFGATFAASSTGVGNIYLYKQGTGTLSLTGSGVLGNINNTAGAVAFNGGNYTSYYYTAGNTNATYTVGSGTLAFLGNYNVGAGNNWNITGGSVLLNTNQRFAFNTAGQNFTMSGGQFQVINNQYGVRAGNVNGSTAVAGAASVTFTQTGGLFNVVGSGTALGGFTLGTASATNGTYQDTYTLGGGTLSINAVNYGTNSGGALTLGADTAGVGTTTFYLNGGELAVNGTVTGGQGAGAKQAFVWNGGQLTVGTFVATNLASANGSTNFGTLSNTAGTFAPGDLGIAGRSVITGNYAQSGNGALGLDLLGTNMASQYQNLINPNTFYDTISISGTANLGGDLLINMGGSTPTSSSGFTVVQATGGLTNNLNGAHIVSVGSSNVVVTTDGFGILGMRTNATSLILTNYVFNQYSGSGNWGTGGSNAWTAGVDPNSAVMGAYFGTNGNGSVTLDATRTVSALMLSNASGSTLASSGGAVLRFTNNPGYSTNASLTLARGNGTITAGLNLLTNLSVADTAAASSTLTLSGNISGGSGLTIASSNVGTVLLTGNNTYTGSTLVNGGTLWLAGTNALSYASTMTASNLSVASNGGVVFAVGGPNAFTTNQISSALSNGVFLTGSTLGYDVSGTNLSVSSIVGRGPSSLALYGSGTANLSNDNSGLAGLVVGASRINVSASSSALGGNGAMNTIGGNRDITLDLGGTTQSLGGIRNTSTSGVLTLQNGTLSFTNADFNQYVNNIVFGSLNQASNSSIQGAMLSQPGSYTIAYLNTAPSITNSLDSIGGSSVLSGSNSGVYFILNGGSLALENNYALAGQGPLGYFYAQTNSTISSSAGFTNASSSVIDLSGASVMNFNGQLDMGAATVTLRAGETLNVTNGTLTLTNGIASLGSLIKTGSGTLILGGVNNSTTTTLNGGTILSLGSNSLGANLALSSGLLDLSGQNATFSTVGFNGNNWTVTNGSFVATNAYTASNATVAQNLSGVASFTATGGNVFLTGANTYSGATVVTNGASLYSTYNTNTTYTVTNAGSRFVAAAALDPRWTPAAVAGVVLDAGSILAVDATGTNYTLTASLTNGSAFTLGTYGTGTVTLADPAANYSGVSAIALTGGTLDLGTNALTVTNVTFASGTLQGGIITNSGTYTMATNATSATVAANLSGTGGLSVGTGTLTLAASNSFTGASTLSGGTLNVTASGAIGNTNSITGYGSVLNFGTANTTNRFYLYSPTGTNYTIYVTNGAVVNVTNGTYFSGAANSTNSIIIGSGGVFSNSSTDKMMIGGTPAANSLNLISNNNGTLYSPAWQITRNAGSGGTNLYVQTGSQAVFNSAGSIAILPATSAGTFSNVVTQFLISGGSFNANNFTIGSTTAGVIAANMYNLFSNGLANSSLGAINFGGGLSNTTGMTNVIIMGDGTLGNGTLTASSIVNGYKTNSGYTNQIIWNGGVLRAGGSSSSYLTNGVASVTVSNVGGFFDGNGFSDTIGANIDGTGTLTITNSSATASTVTLSGTNTAGLRIQQGNGVINMSFSGVQTLSTSNNYTGSTTMGGGTLTATASGALGTNSFTINSGTLNLGTSGTTNTSVTGISLNASANSMSQVLVTNNATLNANSFTFGGAGNVNSTNAVVIQSGGTFIAGGGYYSRFSGNNQLTLLSNNGGNFSINIADWSRATNTNSTFKFIQTAGQGTFTANQSIGQYGDNSTYQFIVDGGSVLIGSNGAWSFVMGTPYNTAAQVTNTLSELRIGNANFSTRYLTFGGTGATNTLSGNITNVVTLGTGTLGQGTITFAASGGVFNNYAASFTGYTNQFIWNGGVLQAGGMATGFGATFFTNMANTLVTISNAGGIFDIGGFNNTIAANIAGTGALIVTNTGGAGTLTLSGTNSYAGGTRINAGTLAFTSQAALSTGGVTNNSTLAYTGSGAQTLSNIVVSGTGAFVSGGTGTVTLTGNNSFGGAFTISSGVLGFTNSSALGTTGSITDNATLLYSGTDSQNLANNISGTGGLSVASGVLTLSGSNNYSGATTVTNATLNYASSGALTSVSNSSVTVNNGGLVTFTNSGVTNQMLANTSTSQWTINAGGQLVISNNNAVTLGAGGANPNNNVVVINGGLLTIGGSGSLSISPGQGGRINVANGGTLSVLSGGYLLPGNYGQSWGTGSGTNTVTNAFGGTINMTGAYLGNGGTGLNQVLNNGYITNANAFYIGTSAAASATNLLQNFGTGTIVSTGQLIVGNAQAALNEIINSGSITTIGQNIQVGGAANTGTNAIFNNGGTIIYGGAGSGAVSIGNNAGATGLNEIILNGGLMTNTGAAAYFTVGQSTAQSGTNLLVLSNGATLYSYHTVVGANGSQYNLLSNNGGVITQANELAIGAGSSNNLNTVYLGNGTINMGAQSIMFGGRLSNGISQGATNTLTLDSGGVITGTGTTYIGQYSLGNSNTFDLEGGSATLASVSLGATSAKYTNGSSTITATASTNTIYLGGGTLSATQVVAGSASAAVGDSNSIVFNGGTLRAGTGASNNFLSNGVATVTLNSGGGTIDSSSNAITVGASIGGSGGLTKKGAGTLTLSASNSYAGGSTINGGVLVQSNANALGSTNGSLDIASGTLNIGTNNNTFSTVTFGNGTLAGTGTLTARGGYTATNTAALTLSNGLAGAGGFTQNGVGTTTLTGNNSYTGGTFVNAGSLVAGSASALGSSAISLSGGGAFNYSGGSATLANNITVTSETGIIRNSGGGLLTLSGTLTKQGSILAFYGGSYNVTGTITGTSPGGSFNSDLVLSNAAVTLGRSANFYGPTALLAGSTLTAGVGNALPTSTILTVGGAGEGSSVTNSYNLNGYSQTLGGLTSDGNGVNRIYNNSGTQSLLTLAGNSTFGGSINGNMALTVTGGSYVNLSGISDYIGATTINGSSSLNLGTTGSLNHTSNVIVSAGSTFLLGASSKVNASAGLSLQGGTISMGGNGSTRAGYQAFSTLTLTGNSVIDFANLLGNSALSFGSITMNGKSLSIYNWSGNPIYGDASPTRPGTFTQLLSSTGLSKSDLNNISFYSGSGTGFLGNGFWSGGEIVPVPEPAVVIVAFMLLGWLVIANRATLLALLRRRNA